MNSLRPPHWRTVHLSDVAEIRTGVAKSPVVPEDAVHLPYLRVANVQDGRLDLSVVKQMAISASDIERYSLRVGDVLMTEGGDFDKLGRGYVWNGEIERCLHQNHVFAVRPRQDLLDSHFLAYYAASLQGRMHFVRCAKRSTNLASINASQLRATPLLLPPMSEQRQIVKTVLVWENALRTYAALVTAKHRYRRLLMRGLLTGGLRFRGFESSWDELRLGELFEERRESGYDKLPLLAVTATDGVVERSSLDRRDTSAEDKSKHLHVCTGDIVYNTMRMWQGVFGLSPMEGIVSPAYTVCRPTSRIDGLFAAQLFKLPSLVHRFYQHSQGLVSDTWNLKFVHFAMIKVAVPSITEQRKIAGVLQTIDQEIAILERLYELLDKQKRTVIHKLLTGEFQLRSDS